MRVYQELLVISVILCSHSEYGPIMHQLYTRCEVQEKRSDAKVRLAIF
jgi:hypothetical protein